MVQQNSFNQQKVEPQGTVKITKSADRNDKNSLYHIVC